ncbi:MAG: hypothetical protein ABI610_08015, partial [Acidobacteriota bacterium]
PEALLEAAAEALAAIEKAGACAAGRIPTGLGRRRDGLPLPRPACRFARGLPRSRPRDIPSPSGRS